MFQQWHVQGFVAMICENRRGLLLRVYHRIAPAQAIAVDITATIAPTIRLSAANFGEDVVGAGIRPAQGGDVRGGLTRFLTPARPQACSGQH